MIYVSRDSDGKISGVFGCPQPDAIDESGNIICKGIQTTEIAEDDPEVIAFMQSLMAKVEALP